MDLKNRDAILAGHVQSAVNDFILRAGDNSSLITVSRVEIQNAGRQAVVFFSAFPETHSQSALHFLHNGAGETSNILQHDYRIDRLPKISFLPEQK